MELSEPAESREAPRRPLSRSVADQLGSDRRAECDPRTGQCTADIGFQSQCGPGGARHTAANDAEPYHRAADRAHPQEYRAMMTSQAHEPNPCRPRHFKPGPCGPAPQEGPVQQLLETSHTRLIITGALLCLAFTVISARLIEV